jgi:hypothetical protein
MDRYPRKQSEAVTMSSIPDVEAKLRQLASRRKLLAERFEKSPTAIDLALDIKMIDDQVAEYNRQIQADRRARKGT